MAANDGKSHLLITFPLPEPKDFSETFAKATGLRVTWITALYAVSDPAIYHDVDVLATVHALPGTRDLAPRLKYIHVLTAGTDSLQRSPLFADASLRWTSSSGVHGVPMAEWVFMTYLAAERRYTSWTAAHAARRWDRDEAMAVAGQRDLLGQRVGVLGYGSIGRQVARVADALGMHVLAFTAAPRPTPESRRDATYCLPGTGDPDGRIPREWFHGLDRAALHRFLAQQLDLLVVTVPLTAQTRGMLGADEFAVLARHSPEGGAFVSNVARGDVVVQEELVAALKTPGSGVRGAALDVTSPEPLPAESSLWDAPNCFISPHVSSLNVKYLSRCMDILALNVKKPWEERFINEVDTARGY